MQNTSAQTSNTDTYASHIATIEEILKKGGPTPEDYRRLNSSVVSLHVDYADEDVETRKNNDPIETLRAKYPHILSRGPGLIGHTYEKPRGYAGDFEIIDYIYDNHLGDDPEIARWDAFYQHAACATALRNRPACFSEIVDEVKPTELVSLGAGSGQDIQNISNYPDIEKVLLIDSDEDALARAQKRYADDARVTTLKQNVLKPNFNIAAQLVWSSGLFDYFNDRVFVRVLKRVLDNLDAPSTVVIGNFAKGHFSQASMEVFGQWHLHLRTPERLKELAEEAGVHKSNIDVDMEPTGINLFLRIANRP